MAGLVQYKDVVQRIPDLSKALVYDTFQHRRLFADIAQLVLPVLGERFLISETI